MVPDFVPLYAVVTVLFSLLYFLFASISFLFVRFDVPEVAQLFRGLFTAYFWMLAITSAAAATAFAASGRIAFMAGMLLLAASALLMRGWTLQRIDAQQDAWRVGDNAAIRRLRQMHWAAWWRTSWCWRRSLAACPASFALELNHRPSSSLIGARHSARSANLCRLDLRVDLQHVAVGIAEEDRAMAERMVGQWRDQRNALGLQRRRAFSHELRRDAERQLQR